jgi:hypothetical protein
MDDELSADGGLSRRQVIKRGAVVGGAVMWAAPVVQSFTSPAGAQVTTPLCDCTVCAEFDFLGSTFHQVCSLTDESCECGCCCATGNAAVCANCSSGAPCSVAPAIDPASCGPITPGPCP